MKSFLKQQNLLVNQIGQNLPFVVSVSGGQDSILLFFMLIHLNSRLNRNIEIVYGQHFWQPKNFFCPEFLFKLTFLFQNDSTFVIPTKKITTENQARVWRKKAFFRLSQFSKTPQISIGQTKSDILEKNINNIFRGASPNSLVLGRATKKKLPGMFFSPLILSKKEKNPFTIFSQQKTRTNYFGVKNITRMRVGKQFCSIETYFICERSKSLNTACFLTFTNYKKFSQDENIIKKNRNPNSKEVNSSLTQKQKQIYYTWPEFETTKSFSYCFYTKNFKKFDNSFKPLNLISRSTVFKLTKLYHLPTLIDNTNFSNRYSRNKIRHCFLPFSRILITKRTDSLLTKFFFLVGEESQQDEIHLNHLFFTLKLLFKNSISDPHQTQTLGFLTKKDSSLVLKTQRLFFKNLLLSYLDINLNFSQIFTLQQFHFSTTRKLIKKCLEKFG